MKTETWTFETLNMDTRQTEISFTTLTNYIVKSIKKSSVPDSHFHLKLLLTMVLFTSMTFVLFENFYKYILKNDTILSLTPE